MTRFDACALWSILLLAVVPAAAQPVDNIGHERHLHAHNPPHPRSEDRARFTTNRPAAAILPLPSEQDAFVFAVFGDRTGGPADGVSVLADAVRDVNLFEPDLVMTVGDLIQGYNDTDAWMQQMREFKGIMDKLICPWFPVAGNHDVYWRGPEGRKPTGEHESSYEMHFGPLWYAFEHKNAWFIALYSDEGDPATGLKAINRPESQRMSEAQFTWLAETLQKAKGADHVFLFLHHPRWLKGGYGEDWDRVHELLVKAGNVTAVFAGHIHRMRYDGPKDGIEYVTLATTGGHQPGTVPQAGYLHHLHLVTVRKEQVAMAAVPVGAVLDVREITGALAQECENLALSAPEFSEPLTLGPADIDRTLSIAVKNPTSREIDVSLAPDSADSHWLFEPDHAHARIAPGQSRSFEFRVTRGGAIDSAFRPLEIVLDRDYLAPGFRYAIPQRRIEWPASLDPSLLEPAGRMALSVDGSDGHVAVPANSIALPDGPLTLEAWLNADGFGERVGLATKTQNSDYGIFVNNGRPHFSVFLGDRYITARAQAALSPGQWHHVAGVFDGQEVRLYVDGTLAGSTSGSGSRRMSDLPLIIGADVDGRGGATSPFAGRIDVVRLSSSARYTTNFTPEPRLSADADAALLLNFDRQVGPWVVDESSARRLLKPQGGARLVPENR